jgi:hypothetical protein
MKRTQRENTKKKLDEMDRSVLKSTMRIETEKNIP